MLTLILLGKREEARQILAANWRLDGPPHASTTPRLAFLGHLIPFYITAACYEHRPWIGHTPERA